MTDYCSMLHIPKVVIGHIFGQDSLEIRLGTLLLQNKGQINPSWILLDSQSTVDVFCDPLGVMTTNMAGDSKHIIPTQRNGKVPRPI